MPRKPSDVVAAIKEKVTRAKATPAPPSTVQPPQLDEWRCETCGNTANGETCAVNGSKGKP